MNYELAAELNDAGFPQGGTGSWIGPPDKIVWRSGDRVYVPTLGELIEACGERFKALTYRPHAKTWSAEADNFMSCGHSSPAEAVAYLWLAL
jgi:hypothetical protein